MSEPLKPARPLPWLDLKIPLWGIMCLIAALAAQSASLLVWGTHLSSETAQNTAAISDLQLKAANVANLRETVARIDERTQALVVTVDRMAASREAGR